MATFYLPLALVLLLSPPAPAQWLSFICAHPKTSPSPPSNTSAGWLSKEDVGMERSVEGGPHSPGGSETVPAGTSGPAQAAAGGSSQFKPLKQWKCGEYQEPSIKERNIRVGVLLL